MSPTVTKQASLEKRLAAVERELAALKLLLNAIGYSWEPWLEVVDRENKG